MTKQKIVVKVSMHNDKKARKALKIAVSVCGVESAAFEGLDKNQIAVTGEGIDSVQLTKLLRKGVGCAEIVSLGPVEEAKPAASETEATVVPWHVYPSYYNNYGVGYRVYEAPCNNDSSCTIM